MLRKMYDQSKLFTFALSAWGLGVLFILLYLSNIIGEITPTQNYLPKIDLFDKIDNYLFIRITINNLAVGFTIAILGYLSGGVASILIIFWNGVLFGILLFSGFQLNIPQIILIKNICFHGPIEIIGLCMFGAIGLKGSAIYKNIFFNKQITFNNLPKFKEFIIPTLLIIIAAFIESKIIV